MADRIVIHIGTMKSGTTYLQNVLHRFRDELAETGWLYPDSRQTEHDVPSHERALGGLVGSAIPWVTAEMQRVRRPYFDRLRTDVEQWPDTALLSAEALAVMEADGIDLLLGALPVARVDIVLTARDLGRVLPSSWQQNLRNGRSGSFDAYLAAIKEARGTTDPSLAQTTFWRSYRLAAVVRRWGRAVGLDRVTIATVPRSGPPTELWQRFHRAVGLPDSIPLDPPEVPRLLAHLGATAPEALLVEAIVRDMEARGAPLRRRAARVRRLMQDVLLPRPERGDPLRLPARWAEEVADWARDDVRELDGLGVRVMGDLDDLLVNDVGVSGPLAPADQVATAAAAALILPERREPPKRPLVSRLSRVIGRRIRSVRRLAAS